MTTPASGDRPANHVPLAADRGEWITGAARPSGRRSVIRAVCFDYFDTLVTHRESPPSHGDRIGHPTAFSEVWREWGRRRQSSITSYSALLMAAYERAGADPDQVVVESLCEERRTRQKELLLNPEQRIIDMIAACKEDGLAVAVVSNAAHEDLSSWERSPFAALVDATAFSFDVGALKPDPLIYATACLRLGLPASTCAFVSDAPPDLEGAKANGFAAGYWATWYLSEPRFLAGRHAGWPPVGDPAAIPAEVAADASC